MQHKINTTGVPSLTDLHRKQVKAFYLVLLTQVIEYKRQKAKEEVCPTNEQKCTSTEVTT